MSESLPNYEQTDDPLQSLIADFLDAEGRGESIDREAWLAQHSIHAESLRDFLANHDRMKKSAPIAPDDVTLPPKSHTQNDATLPPIVASSAKLRAVSVGDRLGYFGDYELLEEIARGGMGVVYKARQVNLNRIVALKMILAGQLASEQDVQRFRTEAESAANLDHPRIVPIYEVGQHAGQHYFSMGLVDGQSLAQRIIDGPMAPREAAEMLVKVCEGIAYAHERGVIHRDLKPANILLDQNGQPKVTDFGLAKKLGSDSNLTGTGQILGTPSYMAPEQASGKIDEVGPLADVYALGAILYCLLTGRPPFQAANPMDTLLQVLDKDPISLSELNASIPRDLETICLKCLSKEPHRRYADALQLSQELDRFLRGEPILARPTTALDRVYKWAKRRPAIAGLLATIFVVGSIGSSGITWQWRVAVAAQKLATEQQRIAEKERDSASRSLYVANLHLARQAWESKEITRLQEVLQRCVPQQGRRDLRGWEWYFLHSQSQTVVSLVGHTRPISAIAWSPDGKRLASTAQEDGDGGGELKIWDAKTGRELFVLENRANYALRAVAWSPDGQRLASGGGRNSGFQNTIPGELKIWNAQTGTLLTTLTGHIGQVNSVAFSPSGRLLASAAGAFGPPGEVKIWDCETGEQLQDLAGHDNQVNSVSWSPDGKRLATTTSNGTIKIWDAQSWEVKHSFETPKSCNEAIWSPDGQRLATYSADQVHRIWDIESGQQLLEIPVSPNGPPSWAAGSGWLNDGKCLSWIDNDGAVTLWDIDTNKALESFRCDKRRVQSAAWCPTDRRLAVTGSDQAIRIVDTSPAKEVPVIEGGLRICVTRDGRKIAVLGEQVKIWDLSSQTHVQTWAWPAGWNVVAAAWSPDAKRMVASGARTFPGGMKMWDCETETELSAWQPHVGAPVSVDWKPDGKQFATGGLDELVKVWDASKPEQEVAKLEGHGGMVTSVVWHPHENRLASACTDGKVRLWDLNDPAKTRELDAHVGMATSIDWSPDGNKILSGGIDGLKIWDSQTGTELVSLQGHTDQIIAVAWQPGQGAGPQRIASLGMDNMLKLWDLEDMQEVLSIEGVDSQLISIVWSPDGKKLIVNTPKSVQILHGESSRESSHELSAEKNQNPN